MSTSEFEQVQIVLTIPPALETRLIDWLLLADGGIGFSSYSVFGHSSRHDHLSIAEQVQGRQKRIQFQVHISFSRLETFMSELSAQFAGADLHYSVAPLLAGGHLKAESRG
jgi:hypothetical protein